MKYSPKFSMTETETAAFLHKMTTGRLATVNDEGYPVIIPLNFVFDSNVIYFHSAPFGEKLDHIEKRSQVGFEVDQTIATLPCYYFYGTKDPSETDTLYKSVVMKGTARRIWDPEEKVKPLAELMKKYQPEGGYDLVTTDNKGLNTAAVVEIKIERLTSKKKIGQNWKPEKRLFIADQIKKHDPHYKEIFEEIDIVESEVRPGQVQLRIKSDA